MSQGYLAYIQEERASMMRFIDPPRLPTIDLSLFDIGDPWRDHVAAQVDWAASTFGLFQILGHGVDPLLIDTLLELGGKYIALEERTKGRGAAQLEDLPGFQDTVAEYTTTMTGLGHKLMTAMARGLHLDDSFFVDRYSGNPVTSLRIRDYAVAGMPVAGRPGGRANLDRTREADDASDRGLLTIVKLGESEGQEVFFDDRWVDVPAQPSALLCYVGPVLEQLTEGHYVSAAHRVSLGDARDRPSLSFAFEPGSDAVLSPVAGVRPRLDSAGHSRYAFAARG
jgi:isopenicillin N synthase-like dioxygenase